MPRISGITLIAAVVCWLASLPAAAATKLTFMYTAVNQFVGIYVAKDQGILDRHGLDIDLVITPNGSVISAALVADSAQIGGPTPTVLLQANEQGLDLVVVAGTEVYPINARGGVLAGADSGIKDAQDLVGKKLAVPGLGGIIDVLTKKWVQAAGVDYRKIAWVEIAFGQMGDALKTRLVDAGASVDPFYSRVLNEKIGYDIGSFSAVVPDGTSPVNFVATRAWAQGHADAVAALRTALDEAIRFIKDPANDAAVRASLAKHTKLPLAAAATLAIPQHFEIRVRPESLRFWIEVSREQGLIKGNPDPASLIAP